MQYHLPIFVWASGVAPESMPAAGQVVNQIHQQASCRASQPAPTHDCKAEPTKSTAPADTPAYAALAAPTLPFHPKKRSAHRGTKASNSASMPVVRPVAEQTRSLGNGCTQSLGSLRSWAPSKRHPRPPLAPCWPSVVSPPEARVAVPPSSETRDAASHSHGCSACGACGRGLRYFAQVAFRNEDIPIYLKASGRLHQIGLHLVDLSRHWPVPRRFRRKPGQHKSSSAVFGPIRPNIGQFRPTSTNLTELNWPSSNAVWPRSTNTGQT